MGVHNCFYLTNKKCGENWSNVVLVLSSVNKRGLVLMFDVPNHKEMTNKRMSGGGKKGGM
jgi:hypothetical protein